MSIIGTLETILNKEPWTDGALCTQVDADLWFPVQGASTKEARAICARCDVRLQCLEYALAHNERTGIWGGLTERQRRDLRRSA